MVGIKGRTGNPGQSNPKKRSNGSFSVAPGKEPRSEKPIAFRPNISLEAKINAAVAASGMSKTEWLETAIMAYLEQNPPILGDEQTKTEIVD